MASVKEADKKHKDSNSSKKAPKNDAVTEDVSVERKSKKDRKEKNDKKSSKEKLDTRENLEQKGKQKEKVEGAKSDKVVVKDKNDEAEKKKGNVRSKEDKKALSKHETITTATASLQSFPTVAPASQLDAGLASLFSQPVIIAPEVPSSHAAALPVSKPEKDASGESEGEEDVSMDSEDEDVESDSDVDMDGSVHLRDVLTAVDKDKSSDKILSASPPPPDRKRKREAGLEKGDDDLEGRYFDKVSRLARETNPHNNALESGSDTYTPVKPASDSDSDSDSNPVSDSDSDVEIPVHESVDKTKLSEEEDKKKRTIFIGNVPVTAVVNKKERKALIQLISNALSNKEHKVASLRFRSTPYASAIPKRASYAKGDVHTSTAHSTNAYAVLSHVEGVDEAVRKLNGSVFLSRHLRFDSVAHPSPVNHRRCVFVGNLGFVDDDSAIREDNDARVSRKSGKDKKPRKKSEPEDVEEGLWRTFGTVGTVENVRVIRDSNTRVGKGFAYVQFKDENSVDQALLLDGKSFPPMLRRKLRVARAKSSVSLKRQKEGRLSRGQDKGRSAHGSGAGAGGRPNRNSKHGAAKRTADGHGTTGDKRTSVSSSGDRPMKKRKTINEGGEGDGKKEEAESKRPKKALSGPKLERRKVRTKAWKDAQK